MKELENVNPTILAGSQLPSRAQKKIARSGPDAKYDHLVLPRADGADDVTGEDLLDEQEIYGMHAIFIEPGKIRQLTSRRPHLHCVGP